MKRVISILLVCLVSILPILCILMVHHITLGNTIQQMEDGTFGKSTSLILMSDSNAEVREKVYNAIKNQEASVGIYLDDTENTSFTVRYMAFSDRYITLPMISGRFFKKTDL